MRLFTKAYFLPIFLWLIAIHSFFVGLVLILSPSEFFEYLGYNSVTEKFSSTQGSVFNILMSVGYLLAALKIKETFDLVIFSIIAKTTASFFLIIYFLAVSKELIILLSGIGDGVMAVLLWSAFSKYKLEANL